MNRDELDRLLKSAPLPLRPAGYWDEFEKKVLAALQRQPAGGVAPAVRPPRSIFPRFAVIGLAAGCIAAGLFFGVQKYREPARASSQLAEARKCYAEIEALFPNQLRAIVFDREGTHLV